MPYSHSKIEIPETPVGMCQGNVVGSKQRNYMTVNLSLIVGHIQNWKSSARRGGCRALEIEGWRVCCRLSGVDRVYSVICIVIGMCSDGVLKVCRLDVSWCCFTYPSSLRFGWQSWIPRQPVGLEFQNRNLLLQLEVHSLRRHLPHLRSIFQSCYMPSCRFLR